MSRSENQEPRRGLPTVGRQEPRHPPLRANKLCKKKIRREKPLRRKVKNAVRLPVADRQGLQKLNTRAKSVTADRVAPQILCASASLRESKNPPQRVLGLPAARQVLSTPSYFSSTAISCATKLSSGPSPIFLRIEKRVFSMVRALLLSTSASSLVDKLSRR
jgi:hypothetical protein